MEGSCFWVGWWGERGDERGDGEERKVREKDIFCCCAVAATHPHRRRKVPSNECFLFLSLSFSLSHLARPHAKVRAHRVHHLLDAPVGLGGVVGLERAGLERPSAGAAFVELTEQRKRRRRNRRRRKQSPLDAGSGDGGASAAPGARRRHRRRRPRQGGECAPGREGRSSAGHVGEGGGGRREKKTEGREK